MIRALNPDGSKHYPITARLRLSGGVMVTIFILEARAYIFIELSAKFGFPSINGDPWISFAEIQTLEKINGGDIFSAMNQEIQLKAGLGILIQSCFSIDIDAMFIHIHIHWCIVWFHQEWSIVLADFSKYPRTTEPVLTPGRVNPYALKGIGPGEEPGAGRVLRFGQGANGNGEGSVEWYSDSASGTPNMRGLSSRGPVSLPSAPYGTPIEHCGGEYPISLGIDGSCPVTYRLGMFDDASMASIFSNLIQVGSGGDLRLGSCNTLTFADPQGDMSYRFSGSPCQSVIQTPYQDDITINGLPSDYVSKGISVVGSLDSLTSNVPFTTYRILLIQPV